MLKTIFHIASALTLAIIALSLSACTPKYDWREVRGTDAPFIVLLPAKPATMSRQINLDGTQLTMTMTAVDIDGVSFAVGTAELPDEVQAHRALNAMKTALLNNIKGIVTHEKAGALAQKTGKITSLDIDAISSSVNNGGKQPKRLIARFTAKNNHVYQAVVVGPVKSISSDAVDTFFTSFKVL